MAFEFVILKLFGAHLALTHGIMITLLNMVPKILLIPHYRPYGAIGATVITFTIGIIVFYIRGKRLEGSLNTTRHPDE